ncbi:MAG: gamma-glutamyltransferase [Dehalococcoidia bacterium]
MAPPAPANTPADLHSPARGPVFGKRGVAASGQPLATLAGLDVLRGGGNAIDAALAVSAVMVVTQPYSSHLGGDAFTIIRTASGETVALNAGGRAPLAATPERFPDGVPLRGPTAVAVPGLVDAWCALQQRFATRPLAELLAPAIALARDGFPTSQSLGRVARGSQDELTADPGCNEVFFGEGVARAGKILRQPDLARTLEAIASDGRNGFYGGAVGKRITAYMEEHGGLLSDEDLARDQAVWGEPLRVDYRGCTVYEQPLPSQGFLALEALNIVEGFDLANAPATSADAVHPCAEAMRLAFADRDAHVGDPDAVEVPIERLLSKEHAAELRQRITNGAEAPTTSALRGGDTTSFAVADEQGNLVSFIQSIFHPWGSAVLVPGTGVLLNNRMLGFSLDAASPNALRPGMRTVHTLNTWLLDGPDGVVYAGGTPGADFQVQTNLQVITNLVDRRLDPQSAIDAPKWVLTARGDLAPKWVLTARGDLALEGRFPQETLDELSKRGHRVKPGAAWETTFSRSQLVARRADGTLLAASDLRGEGSALGWS